MSGYDYILPFQQELLDHVDLALDEIDRGGNSQGILLVGDSGSGKTHALDLVASRYPLRRDRSPPGVQATTDCCRISAASKADATSLLASGITQLGKPVTASSAKLNALEADLYAAVRAQKVRIVILEELHNALLSDEKRFRAQVGRLLKNLWNLHPIDASLGWAAPQSDRGDHRLVIIASGIVDLKTAFLRDAELKSRFGPVVEAPGFGFYPDESLRDFRGVLRSMADKFGLLDILDPNDELMVACFLLACKSHLRILEKFLGRMASLRRRSVETPTPVELAIRAVDQQTGIKNASENPFRWEAGELAKKVMAMKKSQMDAERGRR